MGAAQAGSPLLPGHKDQFSPFKDHTPLFVFTHPAHIMSENCRSSCLVFISVFLFLFFFVRPNSTALRFSSTASRQSVH